MATNDAVLMMEPPPARRRAGIPYLQPRKTPLRLTLMVRSQTSSSVDVASPSPAREMPALLNSMSSRPKASSAALTIACESWALATSAWTKTASLPFDFSSATATRAPSLANRRADSNPIPAPPPVMRATFPSRRVPIFFTPSSRPLEVSRPLPARHHFVELPLLGAENVEIMRCHALPEGFARQAAALEFVDRLAQGGRNARQTGGIV